MTQLPVEQLAVMTPAVAVRKYFDEQNVVRLRLFFIVSAVSAVITIIYCIAARRAILPLFVGILDFVLVAGTVAILQPKRITARPVNVRFWTIAYLVLQFAVLMAASYGDEGVMVWAVVFPILLFALRYNWSEGLLLHGALVAMASFTSYFGGMPKKMTPHSVLLPAIFLNAIILGLNLLVARRAKKQYLGTWTELHESAKEQMRMRGELQYARELQLSMLPDAPPSAPWLDIAAISIPASEVGGDYYDYFTVDDARMAIVCGDVAGHGFASGLLLAAMRGGLTLLRDAMHEPARVLTRLDELVAQMSRRRMLVSAAILLLDREHGRATIASAGHPPVIVRSNGNAQPLELYSPPLGTKLRWTVPQRELAVAPGDLFVLHTDGLFEATDPNGQPYGIERITQLVREHDGAPAETLRDALVRDVERFRGSAAQGDDITVVVVRVV